MKFTLWVNWRFFGIKPVREVPLRDSVKSPVVILPIPFRSLCPEAPFRRAIFGKRTDNDVFKWFSLMVVVGKSFNEPEPAIVFSEINYVASSVERSHFGLFEKGVMISGGGWCPTIIKAETN